MLLKPVRIPIHTKVASWAVMAEMPSRPFQDDFIRFFCRISSLDPETREEARRLHRVRMDAWSTRRNIQKEWFAKAGSMPRAGSAGSCSTTSTPSNANSWDIMTGPGKAIVFA
jgi:hypothetical protein